MGREWAEEEFATVELGDQRLKKRLVDIAEAFAEYPGGSIPEATVDWKRTKGSYRFFDNEKVRAEKILAGHKHSSAKRVDEYAKTPMLFAIQDTTEISYASHPGLELGYGRTPGSNSLFLHATL